MYIVYYIHTASKMWCLGRLLPLIIGDLVPEGDEKWELFLQLLTIIDYVFAPKTTSEVVAYVRLLIKYHHTKFTLLYPDCSILPKMHYMVHIPSWMERYVTVGVLLVVTKLAGTCVHPKYKWICTLGQFPE